jgi:hypothetical protein
MNDETKKKVGLGLSGFLGLAFCASAFFKFVPPPDAAENLEKLGLAASLMPSLGVIEIISALLFLIPKTSFIGAILLTGYMGGAIVTHLRVGDPIVVQILLPIFVWIGFGLRSPSTIRSGLKLT